MAGITSRCPVCDEEVKPGETACSRCGFKLIGETQMFAPVNVKAKEEEVNETSATPALEVAKGPYAGETFTMGEGTFTLGRDPGCDVFLSNMTVSRHHATITVKNGVATIKDEGSLNGTWVDGNVVEMATLNPGSHVQVGTFEMIYKVING